MMHFGKMNQLRRYTVNGRVTESGVEQGGIGVQGHRSLKVMTQHGTLASIGWGIGYTRRDIILLIWRFW